MGREEGERGGREKGGKVTDGREEDVKDVKGRREGLRHKCWGRTPCISFFRFLFQLFCNSCSLPLWQGCGLGIDVSVSIRSRDVATSRLGLVSRKIVNVSVSSRSQEADVSVSFRSRPFTSRAQDQCINSFLMGMQMALYAV